VSNELIAMMLDNGALGASMSGSGAAVFGIFRNHLDAQNFYKHSRRGDVRFYIARPASHGVEIINKL